MSVGPFSFLVLGFGLLMSLTCGASPQLEALKDDWAAEKLALPKTARAWREWKTKELEPLKRMVERYRGDELPRHLSLGEYFALCNVDPTNHYYKIDLVKAWLDGRLLD